MSKPRGIYGCSMITVRTSPHSRNVWRNSGAKPKRRKTNGTPPTEKQLKLADSIAKRKGIKRPWFEDRKKAAVWIASNL